jgi:hypothetical protein
MAKSMMVTWSRLLLVAVLFGGANRADAQTVVVNFSGTGPGASTFQGYLGYTQSLHGAGGRFTFTTQFHEIEYSGSSLPVVPPCSGPGCSYTITTSGTTFTLVSVCPKSPATTVTIVLPCNMTLSATGLPPCSAFVSSPPANTAHFTLTGGTNYSGTITSVWCPTAPAPAPAQPAPYVEACSPPQTCPVYACQPRPACCLTRLFARLCHRNNCW